MFRMHEAARLNDVPREWRSSARDGNNGCFGFESPEPGWWLFVIASDEGGWEHVSAHARIGSVRNPVERRKKGSRIPTWREMQFLKRQCWGDEDVVVQFHPRRSEYVNNHPHVLHLWRPIGVELPTPPAEYVGVLEDPHARPSPTTTTPHEPRAASAESSAPESHADR